MMHSYTLFFDFIELAKKVLILVLMDDALVHGVKALATSAVGQS